MEDKEMQTTEAVDSNMNINADENAAGTTHLNDKVEESETDKLKAELDEHKDKYLRLAAEFDNFRRRTSKERLELIQTDLEQLHYVNSHIIPIFKTTNGKSYA